MVSEIEKKLDGSFVYYNLAHMLKALLKLSMNDETKTTMGENGLFTVLLRLLKEVNNLEVHDLALKTIWCVLVYFTLHTCFLIATIKFMLL
jgi:hypothetical protein